MKNLLTRTGLFILIPFIFFETVFRLLPYPHEVYLSRSDPFYSVKKDKAQTYYYFIGSSHVAAAIADGMLNQELTEFHINVVNAGKGSSSGSMFYLALKKLAHEGKLSGCKVFLEAPYGLASYYEAESGSWVRNENVHLLIPQLDFESFRDFLKYSDNDFPVKLELSFNYFFKTIRIFSFCREIIQNNSFSGLIFKFLRSHKPVNSVTFSSGIAAKGGIKTDSAAIENARKLAATWFKKDAAHQRYIDIDTWRNSRLEEIIILLRKYNSELILFEMPVSSVEAQIYTTETARRNIATFREFLKQENIKTLTFDFSDYSDGDFPDLWHLSSTKSIEFSSELLSVIKNSDLAPSSSKFHHTAVH